jgi:hypothetical protein
VRKSTKKHSNYKIGLFKSCIKTGKNRKTNFLRKSLISKVSPLILFFILTFLIIAMSISSCAGITPPAEEMEILEEKTLPREELAFDKVGEAELPATEEPELEVVSEGEYAFSPQAATMERKMIYRGYMELEVEKGKFSEKFDEIANIAKAVGGFVSNTESSAYGDQLARGTITIRIPVESFDSVIEQIKKLGNVKNLNTNVQEVTQEYVDLESRLKHFQAQEEVLLKMMKESETVEDSISVHRELSRVQEQIEIIKGRLRWLDEQISLSTITVFVTEPSVKPKPEPITWEFLDALREGARLFISVINGTVIFIMAIFPIAVIGALVFLIVKYIIKRLKTKKETTK